MTVHVRAADPGDIPAIAALLLDDATIRESLSPHLWAVAPNARIRVRDSLATISEPVAGPVRHHWTVAEQNGAVVAVTHAVNMPPPPTYDLADGTAGVLLDDCHFADETDVSQALLRATERALLDSGAVLFVAASPNDWTTRTRFLLARGYEATTLYMAKTGLFTSWPDGSTRCATAVDVDGIVRLSARHRAAQKAASPLFWNTHGEADARFAGWMRISLALPDREMFVSGAPGEVDGYIIAQPCSSWLVPPAHEVAPIGLIDDFYATAFEPSQEISDADHAVALLATAENAFHRKNIDTALAICPARMTTKADFLRSRGYTTANFWMVKVNRP